MEKEEEEEEDEEENWEQQGGFRVGKVEGNIAPGYVPGRHGGGGGSRMAPTF